MYTVPIWALKDPADFYYGSFRQSFSNDPIMKSPDLTSLNLKFATLNPKTLNPVDLNPRTLNPEP